MGYRWTCAKCSRTYDSGEPIVFPVHCRCGAVDRTGDTVIAIEYAPTKSSAASAAVRYLNATSRWVAAGRPIRTDEQVDEILQTACSPCEHFQENRCMHPSCGCQIRSVEGEKETLFSWVLPTAMINKLRMATENCPIGKW